MSILRRAQSEEIEERQEDNDHYWQTMRPEELHNIKNMMEG